MTSLCAEAGVDPLSVFGTPERVQAAWRTRDAKLGTRGFFTVEHLPPQMMYDLYVTWLQHDVLRMKHHEIHILEKPNKIRFGGCVESSEGVSHHLIPTGLTLSCLGCQDFVDEPAI